PRGVDERGVEPRRRSGALDLRGAAAHEEPPPPALRAPRLRDAAMAGMHRLAADQVHYEWNNGLDARIEIEPGDTVAFDTRDAADGYYSRDSTHGDVLGRGPFRGHPLTGPVRVRGAAPGDVLVVEVLDIEPAADFGWTAIRPGRGLLPEADFP